MIVWVLVGERDLYSRVVVFSIALSCATQEKAVGMDVVLDTVEHIWISMSCLSNPSIAILHIMRRKGSS